MLECQSILEDIGIAWSSTLLVDCDDWDSSDGRSSYESGEDGSEDHDCRIEEDDRQKWGAVD